MIIPTYQPLGNSTHLLAQKIGKIHDTKATHTGTLDPMAEGVVIVLTNQDRFQKQTYTTWKKTYRFQILWGVSTDSHDLLGMPKNSHFINENKTNENQPSPIKKNATINTRFHSKILKKIAEIQPFFVGKQTQQIPTFSAKRRNGKSLFDVGKDLSKSRSKNVEKTTQKNTNYFSNIEIFGLEQNHSATQTIPAQQIITQLSQVIPKLTNDFRQEIILEKWQNWLNTLPNREKTQLLLTTHTATTSKRTYIRGLVRDMSQKIGIPATTFHILRTANGPYQIKDCVCLI